MNCSPKTTTGWKEGAVNKHNALEETAFDICFRALGYCLPRVLLPLFSHLHTFTLSLVSPRLSRSLRPRFRIATGEKDLIRFLRVYI